MGDQYPAGQYFRGYLASNDLTTAAVIPLFDADGNAMTVPIGKRPIVSEIVLNNGATASIMTVFADTDGSASLNSGEELYSVSLAINAGNNSPLTDDVFAGRVIKAGTPNKNVLMVVASAASVGTRVILVGRIINT